VNKQEPMSSYRQILYNLIFRTKDSRKTLVQEHSRELYAYLLGFIKNNMRDLKTSSSIWLKQTGNFPAFKGWADGYAALTYAWKDKDMIVNYINNQQEHHKNETFEEELRQLLKEHGINVNERFFP
jgi:putative transposase